MTILLEMFLVIIVLALIIGFIAATITMAFDMSIPEIIEWWEKRRKMKVVRCKDCIYRSNDGSCSKDSEKDETH